MAETELKFTLDDAAADRLRARLTQLSPTQGSPETRALHSVYYDTKGHRLKQAGVALRLRRDGDRWVQTVKAKTTNKNGLQVAEEAECPLPKAKLSLKRIPDKGLRKSVKALIGKRALRPVCETEVERLLMVMRDCEGTAVEVALDRGWIRAGAEERAFQELELELLSGDAAALYALAAELLPDGGLEPSRLSKSERGYLLAASGRITPHLAPRNAAPVPLHPKMTTAEAAQALLGECADQVLSNLAVVRHLDDPEGPHQLRIGLRRLRSTMDLFADLLAGPDLAHLKTEAKWLGQMVGKQRDLDVAVVDLLGPAAAADPENAALGELCKLAETRATANRPVLRDILETTRAQHFALDLAAYAALARWRETAAAKLCNRPVTAQMRKALDKAWRRVARRAEGIAGLDHDARHALRKALKGLRYQIEFAAPLYPSAEVATYIKRMKKLQALFGDLNDLAMLNDLFTDADGTLPDDPALRDTLQRELAARNAAAEADWHKAQAIWAKVEASPAFWK